MRWNYESCGLRSRFNMRPTIRHLLVMALGLANHVHPADADISAFRDQLESRLPPLLDRFRIPGVAVAVIHEGDVVFRAGFGFTDHGRTRPVTPATVFNAASISKSMSAVGAMYLTERRLLDLDRPVDGSIRGWQVPKQPDDPVTLRRLLAHTSGLSVGAIGTYVVGQATPSLVAELDGHDGRAGVHIRHPADEFNYSGGGYGVVQLLVEEATGLPFASFMTGEILEPLGMHHSSYRWDDSAEHAAVPHEGGLPVEPVTHVFEAAGSLQTTVDDMAKFLRFVLGVTDGPLAGGTLEVIQRKPFGLGFNVSTMFGRKVVAHGAGNRGWSGQFALFPELQAGIVILTNGSSGTDIINAVLYAWTRHLHQFDLGRVPTNDPEFPINLAPEAFERPIGSYRAPNGLVWEFRLVNGHLEVHADGANTRVYARNEDEFFIYPVSGSMSFRFEYGDDDRAIAAFVKARNDEAWTRMPRIED